MKSQTNEILRKLMDEVDISEAELARKTGIPQPTLHRILSGATRSPRGASLSPLANFFSISISQLIGDDQLEIDRIPGTYNPGIQGWSTLPLLNWQQAVDWPELRDELIMGKWDQWISTDADVSVNAFALTVNGEAMAPRFCNGTILVIDPGYEPRDRDFVIAYHKGHKEVTFKQLLIDGEDRYLKPLNPEFKTTLINGQDCRIAGVMIQSRSDFRWAHKD